MYRYFTHAQSYNYIGELQQFAGSYNKTYHTTGMPLTFGRKFLGQYIFHPQVGFFALSNLVQRHTCCMVCFIIRLLIYRLKDFRDEEINGTFYQSELQKVDVWDDDIL
jgi:hypothetical protein